MFIIEKSFSFRPYVDSLGPKKEVQDILQRIEEYIHEKSRKAVIQGQAVRVLHLSGLADYHHNELAHYLQANKCVCTVESGEFGATPIKHSWLKIGDFLIDLTIKQFENCAHTAPDFLRKLFNTHCYVSDNSKSLIYNLYRKTNV